MTASTKAKTPRAKKVAVAPVPAPPGEFAEAA